MALVIMISGKACTGKAPDLEYGDKELKEHAKEICLADLKYAIDRKFYLTTNAQLGKVAWLVGAGKASLIIEDISYHQGRFGEYRRSGLMGWPFRVYCKSKAVTAKGEFSNESDVGCFIWIRDDERQFIAPPSYLTPFIKDWKK